MVKNNIMNFNERCYKLLSKIPKGKISTYKEIAKALNVPCIPTWNAIDTITSDFELYCGRVGTYGGPGRNFGIQNCDLLFGLGTRVSGRITGGNPATFAREAKKYIVDVDLALLKKKFQQVKFDENIYCDLNTFTNIFMI